MKATEQHLIPVVLFIILYEVVLTKMLCMKSKSVTIQMKAIEQCFLVVYYAVQGSCITFESG